MVMGLIIACGALCAIGASWLACSHREAAHDTPERTIGRIEDVLPQTQCRKCGYDGCAPYAEAIVVANASIDLCPPGGDATRRTLAQLLGRDTALRTDGTHDETRRVAVIIEPDCIGCTKCIQACPVDAIIGASGRMHTVVARWCTGCDLCVPVCPTDCIDMRPIEDRSGRWRERVPGAAA